MAGMNEFEAKAQKYVQKICHGAGCVYAGSKRSKSCTVKYADEVVTDFETGGGCLTAAIPKTEGAEFYDNYTSVTPVLVKPNGTVETITISAGELQIINHRRGLRKGPSGKTEYLPR